MRNIWAVLRWLLLGVMFGLMALLGILSFPIVYPFQAFWRRNKYSFGWFFLDDSEKDLISNLYGDEGWRESNGINIENCNWLQRSYIAFRWMALRNPSWNFKLLVAPKKGIPYDIKVITDKGDGGALTFRNHTKFGKQYAFFTVDGRRYFRYSISKHVKLLWIFKRHWIVQLGSSNVRYIYKCKWSSNKKIRLILT